MSPLNELVEAILAKRTTALVHSETLARIEALLARPLEDARHGIRVGKRPRRQPVSLRRSAADLSALRRRIAELERRNLELQFAHSTDAEFAAQHSKVADAMAEAQQAEIAKLAAHRDFLLGCYNETLKALEDLENKHEADRSKRVADLRQLTESNENLEERLEQEQVCLARLEEAKMRECGALVEKVATLEPMAQSLRSQNVYIAAENEALLLKLTRAEASAAVVYPRTAMQEEAFELARAQLESTTRYMASLESDNRRLQERVGRLELAAKDALQTREMLLAANERIAAMEAARGALEEAQRHVSRLEELVCSWNTPGVKWTPAAAAADLREQSMLVSSLSSRLEASHARASELEAERAARDEEVAAMQRRADEMEQRYLDEYKARLSAQMELDAPKVPLQSSANADFQEFRAQAKLFKQTLSTIFGFEFLQYEEDSIVIRVRGHVLYFAIDSQGVVSFKRIEPNGDLPVGVAEMLGGGVVIPKLLGLLLANSTI